MNDGGLRCGVGRAVRNTDGAHERAGIEDASARAEVAGGVLDAESDTIDVHGEGPFEKLRSEAFEIDPERLDAGIVDHDVEPPALGGGLVERRRELKFVGNVRDDAAGGAINVDHVRPGPAEALRDGEADARCRAGNEGDFPREREHQRWPGAAG